MRRLLERVLAVIAGTALFFAAAEIGARLIFAHVVVYDVEMWKYSRQVKIRGRTPGLRFEHAPNASARLMGVEFRTNGDGLRDREHSLLPAPETFRIAALGDSVTLGWGVEEELSFPQALEGLLNRERPLGPDVAFEVLNFGVGNYNTDDEYRMLAGKALAYRPHLVLLGVFLNDAEPSRDAPSPFILRHSAFAVWTWGRLDLLLRRAGARASYVSYYRDLYRDGQPGKESMDRALARIAATCALAGIPVVAALLPDLHRLDDYPFRQIDAHVRELARGNRMSFVELLNALPGGDPRRFWVSRDDTHPNARAHALYAQRLLAEIPWRDLPSRNGRPTAAAPSGQAR